MAEVVISADLWTFVARRFVVIIDRYQHRVYFSPAEPDDVAGANFEVKVVVFV